MTKWMVLKLNRRRHVSRFHEDFDSRDMKQNPIESGDKDMEDKYVSSLFKHYLKQNLRKNYYAATALPPTSYSSPGDLSVDPYHDTHKGNSGDEIRVNGNLSDKEKRRNLEFDLRRPSSRKDSIRGFNGRGYFERDSGEQPLHSARDGQLPPATKYGQFRPMGVRNNFLSGQQIPQQRAPQPPPPTTSRSEQEDLVAMGTNWNSLNSHRVGRSFTNGGSTMQLLQGGGPARKVGSRNSITGLNGNYRNHCHKDTEPRYPDPFIGAPHGFQQRIAELASLEAETIRKEKSSKAKKKAKAEKDS